MTHDEDGVTLYEGDALTVLDDLPSESVNCCVTSPPYWGLRDYGTASWVGGVRVGDNEECDHKTARAAARAERSKGGLQGGTATVDASDMAVAAREYCLMCGAKRVDAGLGLEPTPELYVENMVAVFREVRRVLRPDGTLWLNIGDSYTSGRSGQNGDLVHNSTMQGGRPASLPHKGAATIDGYKPKDLVGIPWMLAFALRADGWWLRSDIIWAKPNPMPESVTDRPTKAHEYVFLLTKSARYYYEADAIRESYNESSLGRYRYDFGKGPAAAVAASPAVGDGHGHSADPNPLGRNVRSVWQIATQPSPLPHFASFPEGIPERCIKAGCPPGGVVLDPFIGTGTTAVVARRLGRKCIGIELSPAYVELATKRLRVGVRGVQAMERGQAELML